MQLLLPPPDPEKNILNFCNYYFVTSALIKLGQIAGNIPWILVPRINNLCLRTVSRNGCTFSPRQGNWCWVTSSSSSRPRTTTTHTASDRYSQGIEATAHAPSSLGLEDSWGPLVDSLEPPFPTCCFKQTCSLTLLSFQFITGSNFNPNDYFARINDFNEYTEVMKHLIISYFFRINDQWW